MMAQNKGLVIAAPHSNSGKTSISMGIIAALKQRGLKVAALKNGPDYIDTSLLQYAGAEKTYNYDVWAMRDVTRARIINDISDGDMVIAEGAMGLFDEPSSTAQMAKDLKLPVILVIDCRSMAGSIAAIVSGFVGFDPNIHIAGVILNHFMSERHENILRQSLQQHLPNIEIIGALPHQQDITINKRHLGLIQPHDDIMINDKINQLAKMITQYCDMDLLLSLMQPLENKAINSNDQNMILPLCQPNQKIAVARDKAFSFLYQHIIADWQYHDIDICYFSPLNDEAPDDDCHAIFLCGGYPELYADTLSQTENFYNAMYHAVQQGKMIYGECGGYMMLGKHLSDKDNQTYHMLRLLPIETAINAPKRVLGYRDIACHHILKGNYRGHEFHYSTDRSIDNNDDYFCHATNYQQENLGRYGVVKGNVVGSYLHIIDRYMT